MKSTPAASNRKMFIIPKKIFGSQLNFITKNKLILDIMKSYMNANEKVKLRAIQCIYCTDLSIGKQRTHRDYDIGSQKSLCIGISLHKNINMHTLINKGSHLANEEQVLIENAVKTNILKEKIIEEDKILKDVDCQCFLYDPYIRHAGNNPTEYDSHRLFFLFYPDNIDEYDLQMIDEASGLRTSSNK